MGKAATDIFEEGAPRKDAFELSRLEVETAPDAKQGITTNKFPMGQAIDEAEANAALETFGEAALRNANGKDKLAAAQMKQEEAAKEQQEEAKHEKSKKNRKAKENAKNTAGKAAARKAAGK